jgi:hypothetical protein
MKLHFKHGEQSSCQSIRCFAKPVSRSDPFIVPPDPLVDSELHKLFEREMCSENISGMIQNNLVAPKSKAHQIQ